MPFTSSVAGIALAHQLLLRTNRCAPIAAAHSTTAHTWGACREWSRASCTLDSFTNASTMVISHSFFQMLSLRAQRSSRPCVRW